MGRSMDELARQWEQLTIANDFVFCKAMLDETVCREVLEAILGVEIERIEYVSRQHVLDAMPDGKSIRLDVYVRDDRGTVYDVEMQASDKPDLARRARFYQSQLTVAQLDRGCPYGELPDSFVIFLCTFDPFGLGKRVYSFENRCEGYPDLALSDGAHTVFLAASEPQSPQDPDELTRLLDYVARGAVQGSTVEHLDRRVQEVLRNDNWRYEFMYYSAHDQDKIAEGEQKLSDLLTALFEAGRIDDARLAVTDAAARKRLYEEFGIGNEGHA